MATSRPPLVSGEKAAVLAINMLEASRKLVGEQYAEIEQLRNERNEARRLAQDASDRAYWVWDASGDEALYTVTNDLTTMSNEMPIMLTAETLRALLKRAGQRG